MKNATKTLKVHAYRRSTPVGRLQKHVEKMQLLASRVSRRLESWNSGESATRESATRESATRESATRESATRESATRESATRGSVVRVFPEQIPVVSRTTQLLEELGELSRVLENKLAGLNELIMELGETAFVPSRPSAAVRWEPGQRVRVAKRFRTKYETVFALDLKSSPRWLDDLVVDKILSTGEISVRHGGRAPFIVCKTHLAAVEDTDE